MQQSNQKCQFCEGAQATLQCLDCTKQLSFLCEDCYKSGHRIDSKRSHKIICLDGSSEAIPSPPSLCTAHNEIKKFICQTCEVTICNCCLLIGKHKGHDAVLFKEVSEHVKKVYGEVAKKSTQILSQLKIFQAEALDKKRNAAKSLIDAKKVVNRNFDYMIQLIEGKKKEMLAELEKEHSEIDASVSYLEELAQQTKERDKKIKGFLQEAEKGITPDRYDELAKRETLTIDDLMECAENTRLKLIPKSLSRPAIDLSNMKSGIKELMESYAKLIPVVYIGNPPIAHEGLLTSVKMWKIVSKMKSSTNCRGIAYDAATKQVYVAESYKGSSIKAYNTMADLTNDVILKDVHLPTKYDGNYMVVYKGELYYVIEDAGKIAKVDLASGTTKATLSLPNASKHNGGGVFNFGGYIDIALTLDPITKAIYVIYQDMSTGQFKISQITSSFDKLDIGNTWVFPGKKKE
eukprot:TRINITY_DN72666_c0_g1_i1.p1 TRINITY_DN72666_c0_g1~~TRINITY_DN72666_c0_g1_i1.p1  ORF type:complete len:462 (+),score=44.70 TRINITY_DN72666_c0_g1_i1:180-1565(+)